MEVSRHPPDGSPFWLIKALPVLDILRESMVPLLYKPWWALAQRQTHLTDDGFRQTVAWLENMRLVGTAGKEIGWVPLLSEEVTWQAVAPKCEEWSQYVSDLFIYLPLPREAWWNKVRGNDYTRESFDAAVAFALEHGWINVPDESGVYRVSRKRALTVDPAAFSKKRNPPSRVVLDTLPLCAGS